MAVTRDEIARRVRLQLDASHLSQQTLAEALGIDASGLSRALAGQRDFKSYEIALIAEALGISVNLLLDELPSGEAPLKIAARVQIDSSPSVREALVRVDVFREVHETLEREGYLNPVAPFALDANNWKGSAPPYVEGERLATLVSSALGMIKPSSRLDDLANTVEGGLGIDVAFERLPNGLDGLSVVSGSLRLALVNTATPASRARWTLAHEVGHIFAGDSSSLLLDENLFSRRSNEESRANAFAAAFLMPRADMNRRWEVSRRDDSSYIASLLVEYGVSLEALAFRLHNLGLINAAGREKVRGMWTSLLEARTRNEDRCESRPPGLLLNRAALAYSEGHLGARSVAALFNADLESFLAVVSPDEEQAEALDDIGDDAGAVGL